MSLKTFEIVWMEYVKQHIQFKVQLSLKVSEWTSADLVEMAAWFSAVTNKLIMHSGRHYDIKSFLPALVNYCHCLKFYFLSWQIITFHLFYFLSYRESTVIFLKGRFYKMSVVGMCVYLYPSLAFKPLNEILIKFAPGMYFGLL